MQQTSTSGNGSITGNTIPRHKTSIVMLGEVGNFVVFWCVFLLVCEEVYYDKELT